jgi:hypothetical protein
MFNQNHHLLSSLIIDGVIKPENVSHLADPTSSGSASQSPNHSSCEIYIVRCRGMKENLQSNLPTAKIYFFNTRSRKILKLVSHNGEAINRANQPETARNLFGWNYRNSERIFYDHQDETCFLFKSKKTHFARRDLDQGTLKNLNTKLTQITHVEKIGKNKFILLGRNNAKKAIYEVHRLDAQPKLIESVKISQSNFDISSLYDMILFSKNPELNQLSTLSSAYDLAVHDPRAKDLVKSITHTYPLSFISPTRIGSNYLMSTLMDQNNVLVFGSLTSNDDGHSLNFSLLTSMVFGEDLFANQNMTGACGVIYGDVTAAGESTELVQMVIAGSYRSSLWSISASIENKADFTLD